VVVELLAVDADVLAVDAPLRLVVAVLLAAELAHGVAHVELAHLRDNRPVVLPERGVLFGVELLDDLVVGHATLDAPLQPERLHSPRVTVLHRPELLAPPRVGVGAQAAGVADGDDEGLDVGRLLVLVQDGGDDVGVPVALAQPGHAPLRPVVEARGPRGGVAPRVELPARRHDVLDPQDGIRADHRRGDEAALRVGYPIA